MHCIKNRVDLRCFEYIHIKGTCVLRLRLKLTQINKVMIVAL